MKKLLPILALVLALLLVTAPAFAAEDHTCDHSGLTIESLHHCVMHARDASHITNRGVAKSLLDILESAQDALDRGQPDVAVNLLHTFINEVNAQSGTHVVADHALHLVEHTQNVIAALGD